MNTFAKIACTITFSAVIFAMNIFTNPAVTTPLTPMVMKLPFVNLAATAILILAIIADVIFNSVPILILFTILAKIA